MVAMRNDHEIHISDGPRWHRVMARDVSADGALEKELEAEFPAARIGRDDGALEVRLKAVHASSRLTGYRWGLERKKKLLAREQTGRLKHGP